MRHSPETDQYKVRRLDQKGLDDVARLFEMVYGRNSGDSHFSKNMTRFIPELKTSVISLTTAPKSQSLFME